MSAQRDWPGVTSTRWFLRPNFWPAPKRWPESLAEGPAFAHAMTKKCLHQEWNQSVEQALETEAEAQAICMQTKDFERAYNAFVAKQKPKFEGD